MLLTLLLVLALLSLASFVQARSNFNNNENNNNNRDGGSGDDDEQQTTGVRGSTCNCNDAECSIVEKLKVGSLCADNLCIGGASAITGDGDPCTSDDVDAKGNSVHARIKDCCTNSTTCAQFAPGACYHSQCIVATGGTFGTCFHQKLPNGQCCLVSTDCPRLACQRATCVAANASSVTGVLVKRGETFHKVFANEAVISVPGVCKYTATGKTCCASEDDCTNCPDDTTPICEVPGVCKCLSTCKNECGKDSDCPALDADHPHWADNPCIQNRCIAGFCRPIKDGNADKDGDGIKCSLDCDDNDPHNGTALFCTVETVATVDFDHDGIPRCGAEVNSTCAGKCPRGTLQVPRDDLARAIFFDNHFFVDKNCDCCDRNASGIDVKIFCGVNSDGDALFDPLENILKPNGLAVNSSNCLEQFCVVLGAFNDANERQDLADAECKLELADKSAQSFDVNDPPACGDFCPNDPARTQPNAFCPIREHTLKGGALASVCNITLDDDVVGGVKACCDQLITRNKANVNAGITDPFQDEVNCCKALSLASAADLNTLAKSNFTTVCNANNEVFPLEFNVCNCSQSTGGTCNGLDVALTCVRDNDRDCYYDCANPVDLCVNRPKTIAASAREKCNIDKATLPAALTDDQLCCLAGIEKGAPFRSLHDAQGATGSDFCDCDDADQTAFQLLACIKDADHDSFPACFPNNNTAMCQLVCASTCAAAANGFSAPSDITCGNIATPPPTLGSKRSLEDVRAVAESHEWFGKRNVITLSKNKCPNKDCVSKVARHDNVCSTTLSSLCPAPKQVLLCDCCDKDCVVFPGSMYTSGTRNKCSLQTGIETDRNDIVGHDYNCDGQVQKFVAAVGATVLAAKNTNHCPSTVSDSREIFDSTDSANVVKTDQPFNTPTQDSAQHDVTHTGCEPKVGGCTTLVPGFDTNPTAASTKRSIINVPGPSWCVNKKYDPRGAASLILFNNCAQFSRNCTYSTNDNAMPDSDQCGVAHEVVMLIGQ